MPKKSFNNEKLRNKIEKQVSKYERKNSKQSKTLQIAQNAQRKLESLLLKVPKEGNDGNRELNEEFKNIHIAFKEEMKILKAEIKLEKQKAKHQKKEQKNERKQRKEKFKEDLENSRVEELPELKTNNLEELDIIVDGWNICGCDKIARKCMRGKRGSGAKRMVFLLHEFGHKSNYSKTNNIRLSIHFDGNGKDYIGEENGVKISVKYSGKGEIVDDRLVREFGENVKNCNLEIGSKVPFTIENNPNRNLLVITSDRELTLRLNKIGVSCMKSGCFYKKYLKEYAFDGLEEFEEERNNKFSKNKSKSKQKKEKKSKKKGKGRKHSKKHWKKYIKNRFSDNSTSSSSSKSSGSSSSSSTSASAPDEEEMEIIDFSTKE